MPAVLIVNEGYHGKAVFIGWVVDASGQPANYTTEDKAVAGVVPRENRETNLKKWPDVAPI